MAIVKIHLIVVTQARVFCLICMPESRGLICTSARMALGIRAYISGRTQVHVLQPLCNTLIARGQTSAQAPWPHFIYI